MKQRRTFRSLVRFVLTAVAAGGVAGSAEAQEGFPSGDPPPLPHKNAVDLSDSDLREAVLSDEVPDSASSASEDSLVVEIIFGNGAAADARDAIRDAGGEPGVTVPGELVQAEVPLDGLEDLEADPAVRFVRPPLDYSEPAEGAEDKPSALDFDPGNAGAYVGEQIAKTNAGAWHAAGITGAGVKVGIIDGFSSIHYSAAVNGGEIPPVSGTFCLNEGMVCNVFSGQRHGIGVAESVSDMAPAAQIYFADTITAADTQAAMNYFASQGVKVVTRSQTGRYDGPGNGTGPIASVIQNAAVNQGMFYLNSAGNSAGRNGATGSYWRSGFTNADADNWLEFADGSEYLYWDCSYQNGLRWNDWGEGAGTTDYDLYVYNEVGTLTSQSLGSQGSTGGSAPPLELAPICFTEISFIRIWLDNPGSGTAGDVLEFMTNGAEVEFASNPFSATGPMSDLNSPGAVSVGAVDPATGTTIARYSSEGPTNDGRLKPDLSAAACVKSLAYAPTCFNGTSSSTPVTAGAAALALSSGAFTTPQQIKAFLLSATVDRGAAGPDNVYGQGELLLPSPQSLDRNPPTVTALKSKGKRGKKASLRYTASDDSGLSQETVVVTNKRKVKATIQSQFGESTGGTYAVAWKVPKRIKGPTSFCVTSADANSNISAQSCAKMKIKKKKRKKQR